jgi:hypothetical protein
MNIIDIGKATGWRSIYENSLKIQPSSFTAKTDVVFISTAVLRHLDRVIEDEYEKL